MESLTPLSINLSVLHKSFFNIIGDGTEFCWASRTAGLLVLNEPRSLLRATSGCHLVLRSGGSLTAHVSGRPTSSSLGIREEGLSPLIQYAEERSDSDSKLSVQGAPIYFRRCYSLLQMLQRQDTRPLPSSAWDDQHWIPPPMPYGLSHLPMDPSKAMYHQQYRGTSMHREHRISHSLVPSNWLPHCEPEETFQEQKARADKEVTPTPKHLIVLTS